MSALDLSIPGMIVLIVVLLTWGWGPIVFGRRTWARLSAVLTSVLLALIVLFPAALPTAAERIAEPFIKRVQAIGQRMIPTTTTTSTTTSTTTTTTTTSRGLG